VVGSDVVVLRRLHAGGGTVMGRPWMPLYIGDYLRDTHQLTTLEHGAYLLLIMHYWNKGPLPDDLGQLSCITGIERRNFPRTWNKLQVFFELRTQEPNLAQASTANAKQLLGKCWHHKRLDSELEKANSISEKRSLAGHRGGLLSRKKNNLSRFVDQAIAKQTGIQSHKKITTTTYDAAKESSEKGKIASPTLEAVMRQKRWIP
jgi:uncharacterized protein YdaU (DUF1376 family)